MSFRVTDAEVFEIIDTTLTDIDPFINTANMMVDAYLLTTTLTDAQLKEIEKYLTAHILSLRDPRTKSESFDSISESFQGNWGVGLNGTSYGQTAILLDTSGTLGVITKIGYKPKIVFGVIGYH